MSVYIQIRCKQKAPLHVIHSYISSERSYLSSVVMLILQKVKRDSAERVMTICRRLTSHSDPYLVN